MGVWSTMGVTENRLCYDWFTCTLSLDSEWFSDHDVNGMFGPFPYLLGLHDVSWEMHRARSGYMFRYSFDGISISTPALDAPSPNILLDMSGTGCRAFETYGSGKWNELFQFALKYCHITRLDVAYDDIEGLLDGPTMYTLYLVKREYVSKSRTHEIIASWEDGSDRRAYTLYIGSKSSDCMLRIYDKSAQLGLDEKIHWFRVEFQLRRNRARQFLEMSEPIGERFAGVLVNTFRFVQPVESDSNRWRWPMHKFWSDLCNSARAIHWATNIGAETNLATIECWLNGQVGNSLYTFIMTKGISALEEMIINGRIYTAIPKKYRHIISSFHGKSEQEFIKELRKINSKEKDDNAE